MTYTEALTKATEISKATIVTAYVHRSIGNPDSYNVTTCLAESHYLAKLDIVASVYDGIADDMLAERELNNV